MSAVEEPEEREGETRSVCEEMASGESQVDKITSNQKPQFPDMTPKSYPPMPIPAVVYTCSYGSGRGYWGVGRRPAGAGGDQRGWEGVGV